MMKDKVLKGDDFEEYDPTDEVSTTAVKAKIDKVVNWRSSQRIR